MALVIADRVKETTTTTGTGTITLAGAASGYQSFSVIGNANTTYYAIVGGTEWEVGIGTYTSSGTTLSRDTVLESSNSNNKVNFSAGTKDVFVTYPADRAVDLNLVQTLTNKTLTSPVISGGTINNATIGATTPTTGAFTVATVNGVQFPATQVQSADANQLDDYEEGTFTPTIAGETTTGTGTYTAQTGRYTKIGNLVVFNIQLNWTAHTGSGNMVINGLPFTPQQAAACATRNSNITLSASNILQMNANTSAVIRFEQYTAGGSAVANVSLDTSAVVFVSGAFQTTG